MNFTYICTSRTNPWTRNSFIATPKQNSSNGSVPITLRRCIINSSWATDTSTQSLPSPSVTVDGESKIYGLKSGDGLVSGRVRGLEPFVTSLSINTKSMIRITKLESESSISSSVVLKFAKNWEKCSIWIIRILVQSLIFAGKYYTPCTLMLEYLDIIRAGFLF